MARIPIQSAKFKKDLVVYFAIGLFFVILGAEIFLAVWLPWHLKFDSMWAEQMARLDAVERFDGLRSRARRAAGTLPKPAAGEAALIQKSLDRITGYLHNYGERLSPEQCRMLVECLNRLQLDLSRLDKKEPFSAEIPLDMNPFLQKLRGVKP